MRRRLKSAKAKILRPVPPNKGIELQYRKKIYRLIDEMNRSVLHFITASFRTNEPEVTELAQDALPANELRKSIRRLTRRWQRRFREAAPEMADWFSQSVNTRSSLAMQQILKKGGWTVEFKMTPAQQDILHATINENVSLIKSIPQQYFTQIEGMVMRSVQTGRDLHQLTNDLQRQFGVTRRRAILIARDQTNKANANLTRARQLELGISRAVWVHSGAGKHPRPTHVRQSGKEFDIKTGWFDPAVKKYIFPGSEINCRCFSKSIVPGFS